MKLHIIGRNIEITPALKGITEEKFQRLAHRHHEINSVHVTLHVEHLTNQADATVDLNGTEFHASAKTDDMYTAIDLLIDKLSAQITKHKDKHKDHH